MSYFGDHAEQTGVIHAHQRRDLGSEGEAHSRWAIFVIFST